MTRRGAPSPIHLLPTHIATPPRGTPKYTLPRLPHLIPLIDTVGPRLHIHAYATPLPTHTVEGLSEPARMGRTTIVVSPPDRVDSPLSRRRREAGFIGSVGASLKLQGERIQPPWLRPRGLDEAVRVRDVGIVVPPEARVRGGKSA